MKVLITGANGMVARAAAEYCRSIGDDVFALTRGELNIADMVSVQTAFDRYEPEIVLNCAAFTDVDGSESNAELAFAANAAGPENLAIACRADSTKFVTISTDYVFDGTKGEPYSADNSPNAKGIYAESKVDGECRVNAANSDAIIVRSGWIFGHGGTNFLSVMHRLLGEGKSIKVISDSYGTPTFAGDLARRMRELASTNANGFIHVTNSGQGTSYYGFAEKVCEIGGFDTQLLAGVLDSDLKRPAPRPQDSRLEPSDLKAFDLAALPNWHDALRNYVNG